MSSNEKVYKDKLLNNEFLEEGSGWAEGDEYYCANKDMEVISFLKSNMDSDFSIKNMVYTFYQILKNRYHNNFYLEFLPSSEYIEFILRGQPIFDSSAINLIVKYVLRISVDNCTLSTHFLIPEDEEFENNRIYVNNFNETSKNLNITDNSDSIKILLDSISLRNYVNKINEHEPLTDDDKPETTEVEPESAETDSDPQENTTRETEEALIYCPHCGEANYPLNRTCQKCKSTLVSYMTSYGNEITSYDEILSEEAIKKIEKAKITPEFYEYILETISNKCKKIDFTDDVNVYDKIVHIVRKFVDVQFEYHPNINKYGSYRYDLVHIYSNQSFSQQCASLIRYLSVEIHLEIMEAIFMYIFDVKNNAFVRNFIDACRFSNINEEIIHTYYPIQVESHFIPKEYHSYDKIIEKYYEVLSKNTMKIKEFESNLIIGNSFAQDIIQILENVIDDGMKKELADEFVFDKEVPTKELRYNIEATLKFPKIIKAIKTDMINTINFINEHDSQKILNDFHEKFEGKGSSI